MVKSVKEEEDVDDDGVNNNKKKNGTYTLRHTYGIGWWWWHVYKFKKYNKLNAFNELLFLWIFILDLSLNLKWHIRPNDDFKITLKIPKTIKKINFTIKNNNKSYKNL